jgi:hypothetical protein
MELGQYQLQIFVGLVVVLAAAFVALICDFLKGNNEQLRELTIELKVRREEEQRHSQTMIPQTVPAVPASRERMRMERLDAVAAPAAHAMSAPVAGRERKRPPSADALAAMARGAELAAAPRKRTAPPQREREAEIQPEIQKTYAQAAPTQEKTSRVAQAPSVQPAAAAPIAKPVTLVARQSVTNNTLAQDGVAKDAVAAHSLAHGITTLSVAKPTVVLNGNGAKKDWGSLLARTAKPQHVTTQPVTAQQVRPMQVTSIQKDAAPVFEVRENSNAMAAGTSTDAQGETAVVPAGFHEGYILSRLVQSRQPVSGLVVSIGVNTPRNSDGSMPEPIRKLVESLIGPGDFACQSSSEEFLLIYPNERGASAQRRLSEIAQQLWDFQLRSLGSFSILFSWGGVEVRSESIDEAIASANERMHETRRGRKLLTMEPRGGQQLRQAV